MVTEQAPSLLQSPILLFIIIFAIWYFLVIKPQKKKQDQHKQQLADLKKNDEIVLASGIHGTIVNVKEKTLIVRIDDNVKIEVDKEAVSFVKQKST